MKTKISSKATPTGLSTLRIFNGIRGLLSGKIKLDSSLFETVKWFYRRGDQTLRLTYPLTPQSVVIDLGGFYGDFAAAISERYHCHIYVYEPMPDYHELCKNRFAGNPQVQCFPYGLAKDTGHLNLSLEGDESSFFRNSEDGNSLCLEVRSIADEFKNRKLESIDLIKINIEGGEFDVLPALIESGWISKIKNLQVQFHRFIPDSSNQRSRIRAGLSKTHRQTWNYDFLWENWERL